mmetsp:Transcript_13028/g.40615  ORF Transcript_13028/g.40615 Transcript_13028/m.40615 type:complete len:260 (+) Transcript_13028:166-945(+)
MCPGNLLLDLSPQHPLSQVKQKFLQRLWFQGHGVKSVVDKIIKDGNNIDKIAISHIGNEPAALLHNVLIHRRARQLGQQATEFGVQLRQRTAHDRVRARLKIARACAALRLAAHGALESLLTSYVSLLPSLLLGQASALPLQDAVPVRIVDGFARRRQHDVLDAARLRVAPVPSKLNLEGKLVPLATYLAEDVHDVGGVLVVRAARLLESRARHRQIRSRIKETGMPIALPLSALAVRSVRTDKRHACASRTLAIHEEN